MPSHGTPHSAHYLRWVASKAFRGIRNRNSVQDRFLARQPMANVQRTPIRLSGWFTAGDEGNLAGT